jgi:unsaturated rhamnogalacturonyl hydrolase
MTTLELLHKAVRKTMQAEEYSGIDADYKTWNWIQGVGMYGLMKSYQLTAEEDCFDYVHDWVRFHLKKGLPEININTTIPMTSVLELYKKTGIPEYRSLCKKYADYCMAEAPRTSEGALEHTVLGYKWNEQIWADTLFMGALFLAQWGSFAREDLYLKEACRQMRLHYKYLTDSATGLMFHGYNCLEKNHMSGVRWGRANGWALISAVEILEAMPPYFTERQDIINNLKKHLDALIPFQHKSGLWSTVMDQADSAEELTVTCCVYYSLSIGIAKGYLDGSYKNIAGKARGGILNNISDRGQFLRTSGPTPVMASVEEYNNIPSSLSYYGQGLGIMALCADRLSGGKDV